MNLDVAIDSEVINIDGSVTKLLEKDDFKYKVKICISTNIIFVVANTYITNFFLKNNALVFYPCVSLFVFYHKLFQYSLVSDLGPKRQCTRGQCNGVFASGRRRPLLVLHTSNR